MICNKSDHTMSACSMTLMDMLLSDAASSSYAGQITVV